MTSHAAALGTSSRFVAAGVYAVLVAWLATIRPEAAIALAVAPAALFLLTSASVRVVVVVFGALLTFQSSTEVSELKALYFLAVAGSTFAALSSISRHPLCKAERHLATSAFLVFALVIVSAVPMSIFDTPASDWARDSFSYFLFGAALILAIDFSRSVEHRFLTVVFLVCGTVGTLSFLLTWIVRRDTGEVGLDGLGFSSFLLAIALVAYATTRALWPGRYRALSTAGAAAAMLALVGTATRSSAVALVAVGIAVALSPLSAGRRLVAVSTVVGVVIAATVLVISGGVAQRLVDVDRTTERLQTVTAIATDPSRDMSLALRRAQTQASLDQFTTSPLVGYGPGHAIEWRASRGYSGDGYFVDSPAGFLAKFGLLGAGLIALALFSIAKAIVALNARRTVAGTSLIAFAGATLSWSALGTPFDDKGLALAASLMLAMTIQESHEYEC